MIATRWKKGYPDCCPLPSNALQKIEEAYNIEYTYESNRIEGNTLTLQETELVVNEGVTIAGKSMREHLEAINHAEAIDYIRDFAKSDIEISERTIKEIHALVLHGINRENAGRYRTVPVMISGSTHIPPQPYLIEKLMEDFILKFREFETGERTRFLLPLPPWWISTHTSVHRRERAHIPAAYELVPIAQRLYIGKSQRLWRCKIRLLQGFGSLAHRETSGSLSNARSRSGKGVFTALFVDSWGRLYNIKQKLYKKNVIPLV